MDTNKYSSDVTAKGDDVQETAGSITPELMQWVLKQCEKRRRTARPSSAWVTTTLSRT